MSTRSRSRWARCGTRPPRVGRLHELALTRRVPTPVPKVWRQLHHLAGPALVKSPQMAVLGQLGRGVSYGGPGRAAKAVDPLTVEYACSSTPHVMTREW